MAGEGGNRRQYVLLALLGVLVVGYFTYGSPTVTVSGETIGDLPPIDIAGVVKGLKDVATVKPEIIGPPGEDSVPDRNLFQYGSKTPPPPLPPPPMTEAERLAEQGRLRIQEENLRKQQAQQEEEEKRRIAEQQAIAAQAPAPVVELSPPVPVAPPKPVPPTINFRFAGVIGSPQKKVGVFMNGDKMILARKGEIIEVNFRVINIGVETASIGYTNPIFKDMRKTLDLGH